MPERRATARQSAGVAIGLALASLPVLAHHTFAMFDGHKKVTLKGTVKELQWTNPHCFIQLLVARGAKVQEWSVQMSGPADLYRNGWRPHSLNQGDEATLIINPSKDGRASGQYVSGTGPADKALPSD